MSAEFNDISFDMPKSKSNTIKVIGVGGGGSNAVNHMFEQNINGVDFVICNTDAQALENSAIPNKIQLGASLTSGLGAGANPEIGAQSAHESIQEIQQMLSVNTKMVFITAGMGGGTGTGAAPIIAKIAKDMDILVVGIVTMPFQFEGKMRSKQAQKGIDALRKNVDSLIVINNNKLREVYGNLGFKAGFSKADEVLSTAAKGIAEVITHHYKQNIDLHDAKTVLSNSGTAIMGSAVESGENRAQNAIKKALDSPLLNDNKITGAKNVLLLIVSGKNEVTLDEIGEINDFIQEEAGYDANIIMGVGEDESLEDGISVTVVATGFALDQQHAITNTEVKKIVHTLEDNQKATYNFDDKVVSKDTPISNPPTNTTNAKVVHVLEEENNDEPKAGLDLIPNSEFVNNIEVIHEEISKETIQEQDFIITNKTQQNLFDLPVINEEVVNTTEAVKNIQVSCEEVKSVSEDKIEKRYTLELDEPLVEKKPTTQSKQEVVEEELQFEMKTKTEQVKETEVVSEEVSPLSLTIAELQQRAQERRKKMKGFNYKFNDKVNKNIDEIESMPAYKRQGVDLDASRSSKSDTTLSTDEDSIQLKNNSFLHDNVD